jgi:peptidoglycan L-alanyl-D-glutamate endopeptidase CwlK
MSIVLGQRSLSRLEGVHPDLVRVVKKAAAMSSLDFTVLEGLRTAVRQKQLFDQGATKTMNSRHLTGHAVDLAPMIGGTVRWDWPLYHQLAAVVKAAAKAENVPIQWGGDWRTFKDGPHWELPWKVYPKGK